MVNEVGDLKIEHVLLFVIVAFLLYHLMGRCGCSGNGFSVGGEGVPDGKWYGTKPSPCDCSKTFKDSQGLYHTYQCADGQIELTGRHRGFCTDQLDPESCKTAGGRDTWVGKDTCKWTPPSPCDCSNTFKDSLGEIHTYQCADGQIELTGRHRGFCTDQPDPESCKTAGGRDTWVGSGTCKWNPPPPPSPTPTPPGPPPPPPPGPDVICIPNLKPPQICPDGTKCPNSGKCNPPGPPPVDQRIIRCNPNIKNPPQICPGDRPCPPNGKCVLPILCKPGAENSCSGYPWTCPPNGMCPRKAQP